MVQCIKYIDEQHKRILNHLNNLYQAIAKRENSNQIINRIEELAEYFQIHFAAEETVMKEFQYSDYSSHKNGHDRILRRIATYTDLYKLGDVSAAFDLTIYLKEWCTKHIEEEDKAIGDLMVEKPLQRRWLPQLW